MTLSELCIRRPVMTVLLSISVVIAGAVAYTRIPVAALPSFNTPIISVSASLPGASPENMAASVALPLEKEFSTIDGITVISSTNFLGTSNITLEFNNDRDIIQFFVANFAYGHETAIYAGQEADENLMEWYRRKQSITKVFIDDLASLLTYVEINKQHTSSIFDFKFNEYPVALTLFLGNKLSIETLVIINELDHFWTIPK